MINAIENLHEDASDISLPESFDALEADRPGSLNISWKADDELHLGQFLAWSGPGDNSHETRVLEAMKQTEIPVPELITAGTADGQSVMLAEPVEGTTIAQQLATSGMRWEVSAIAFTYARMLARIHSLDWTQVTPWLADQESVPEDIVDEQVERSFDSRQQALEHIDTDWRPFAQRAIDWLELRRPVEVSVCLCHGNYRPENVIASGEDITAVVNWQQATVTDASCDLAMLPVWLNEIGLSQEDAELFAQAVNGAYLQASPRGLGNVPYYSVALPFDQLIERLSAKEQPATVDDLAALQGIIERAMSVAGQVPWRNR